MNYPRHVSFLQTLFPRIPADWQEAFLDHERQLARRIAVAAALLTLLVLPVYYAVELVLYPDSQLVGLHNALWRLPVLSVVLLILVLRWLRPDGNWPRLMLQLFAFTLLFMISGIFARALALEPGAIEYTVQGLIISLAAVSIVATRGVRDLPIVYGLPMLTLLILTQLNAVPMGLVAEHLIYPVLMIVVASVIAGLLHHGNVVGFLANQRLRQVAMTDPLTGLLNRRAMGVELAIALSRERRHNQGFALILADLDHFKRINDTHGHDVGDEVLVELTQRLLQTVRIEDRVARWGGEEFLLLIQGADDKAAVQTAEKVRHAVGSVAFVTSAGELEVTISLGVARSRWGTSAEVLITAADRALYQAKQNGRNRTETLSREEA